MRVVLQRVLRASVAIGGEKVSEIGRGMLVFLGVGEDDTDEDVEWLCAKLAKLRIFSDAEGLMNLDITQVCGSFLVVSQFTLHALTKKGNRPSFIRAARPEKAVPMYEHFVERLGVVSGCGVKTGCFGADMQVDLLNDGPVTIIIDSKNRE